jgi:3-hydroxyethyl bacteriochlorophyllide a dehydrogenase
MQTDRLGFAARFERPEMRSSLAIVFERPEFLGLRRLPLDEPGRGEVVVATKWSGISTGTERLLFMGRMPQFPGMGYPLVPGYESVGEIIEAGPEAGLSAGQRVFVPGARCFGPVRGLFGGAAYHLVVPASRIVPIARSLGEQAILLALAATALHARTGIDASDGDLIVGHGVLGRLLARLGVLAGGEPPVVWEKNPARSGGGTGYRVTSPDEDPGRNYKRIFDVSGDPEILDALVQRLAPGGEIVLAGFYESPLSFSFPPAFIREARIRVAAQWLEADLLEVKRVVEDGSLSLEGLISHASPATEAATAYPTAFNVSSCLKMVLDWSESS